MLFVEHLDQNHLLLEELRLGVAHGDDGHGEAVHKEHLGLGGGKRFVLGEKPLEVDASDVVEAERHWWTVRLEDVIAVGG